MQSRDLLIEQLWRPATESGDVRVVVDPEPSSDWLDAETYWMFPDAQRARLVLPRGDRAVTAAAATNYKGMRRPTKNLGRTAMGLAARTGLPVGRSRLAVQVRASAPGAAADLPLAVLARALGVPRLHAATGIRTGANRKATLHLLGDDGSPVGYAKFGWNDVTDTFVRTEGAALREVGGRPGPMRAPALLTQAEWHGHPVIVTEPLPLAVRGARSRKAPEPTPQELYSLCPVERSAPLAGTAHLGALDGRLRAMEGQPLVRAAVAGALGLLERLRAQSGEVPVTRRWHGDMTPWNRARDSTGQLWVWDWESSEPDAVAGLDALHWAFSVRRPASGRNTEVDLPGCLEDAAAALAAAGTPRDRWGDVAAVYALTVVERACDLALRSEGWQRLWIGQEDLGTLLAQAGALASA